MIADHFIEGHLFLVPDHLTPMGGGRAAHRRARAGAAPAAVLARSVSPPAAPPTPIPVQASDRRAGT